MHMFWMLFAVLVKSTFASEGVAPQSAEGSQKVIEAGHSELESGSEQPLQRKQPQKKLKGKVPREKEAEGTQAPNRFDTDIIKSKYEHNGKSLEVDTD